ncbi:MAG: S8 family serine peptidase [Candidatus Cloacimonetes bacterium]|nr:S8 family serine peptidase [Candidatus Cloacimonadota bacterium]
MKKLFLFIVTALFFTSLFADAAMPFNEEYFLPNRIIVGFEWDAIGNRECILDYEMSDGVVETGIASFDQLAEQYGFVDIKQRIDFVKDVDWNDNGLYPGCIYNITLASNDNIETAIDALVADPNIIYAEYEPVYKFDYVPNDASYDMQWFHENIRSEQAWDYITGSEDIVIGIVDSGINWNHPDLQDNIWINEPELNSTSGGSPMTINWTAGTVSGGNGIDDDGNGKIDDCIGWNFYGTQSNQSYQGFVDNAHGTHVAGCAGAVGDNYIGVTGPMMNVKLISSRHSPNNVATNSIWYGDLGIRYCAISGADIINCSFGGPGGSATYNSAINYAVGLGAIVTCAAGNDNIDLGIPGNEHYPGNATNAVCVASTDPNDAKAYSSSYGTPVDVSAPGEGIYSTVIGGSGYENYSGTSMASPVAAGVAGLIKSVHPDLTPQELKTRLEYTCDNIDAVNPDYIGMLGAGRVNAFKGAMYDLIPNLTVAEINLVEQTGDGDGVPNPGEVIDLSINLENDTFWLDAEDITATLSCEVAEVTMLNDETTYSDLASGSSGWNSGDPFSFETPAELSDFTIPFTLTISANPTATWPYIAEHEVEVELTLAQAGWPLVLGSVTTSSGVIIDLEDDDSNEIIFGDYAGMIHVMQADGTPVSPFPIDTGATIVVAVAAGFVDSDNNEDIVIGNDAGHVIAYDHNGNTIFDYLAGGNIKSNPIIADVDGNGTMEVIICTFPAGAVHIINSDGTSFPNFPAALSAPVMASAAVGDLNSDGNLEVLVVTISGSLNAISSNTGSNLSGWPYALGLGSANGPTISNIDADTDPEVLIVTTPGTVFAIDNDGSLIWDIVLGAQVLTGLVTADFNNNGNNDICFIDQPGNIHLLDQAGNYLPNFPVDVGESVESTPVIVDMDANGTLDIVFGDNAGYLHSIDITGAETNLFPINLGSAVKVAPALGYADDDGDIEILVPNQTSYFLIDYKNSSGAVHWANFKRNPQRTGNALDPTSGIEPEVVPVFTNDLGKNYPNPFNPDTNINFSIKEDGFVSLKVYNTRGQLVKTLISENMQEGVHFTTWNGKNNNNKSVSSGIYFYKMDSKGYSSIKKMILMK